MIFPIQWIKRLLRSRFLLATLLAALHTVFLTLVAVNVYLSPDPEAAMAFAIFIPIDYPVLPLGPVGVFLGGGVLWFCYGFVVQSLLSIRRPGGPIRLGIGLLLVALLWSIPEVSLRMKPAWEENWHRAWALDSGPGTDSTKAIRYMNEAIRLSPKNNPELNTLWGHLAMLYTDKKDYPHAEAAYKSLLTYLQAQPHPDPQELSGAYGGLEDIYRLTGNLPAQKECLQKEIAFWHAAHGVDTVAEANLWYSLAQVTHDSGDSKQAQMALDRAITISAALHDEITPLAYWRRKLRDWKNE